MECPDVEALGKDVEMEANRSYASVVTSVR